jgi:N6-L-threonylcarbamoyladenine synthase
MVVLGIESSCDETSAAVVEDGRTIHSLVIASQTELQARYHGVVPEVASRAHVEQILPVVREALERAEIDPQVAAGAAGETGQPSSRRGSAARSRHLDGVAVTNRPGLSGSLAVGLTFAKTYAYAAGLPFVAVDHMHAHAYAPHLSAGSGDLSYPYLVLLVSGGHTMIAVSHGYANLEVLGTTIDDACGEAYDKISVFLGEGYPGGPIIDRLAAGGDPRSARFPQPKLNRADNRYDMSFSGLKTAVVHQLDRFWTEGYGKTRENVAAAFQDAAVGMLMNRVENAVRDTGIYRVAAGGGVAANSELRRRLQDLTVNGQAVKSYLPPVELCVDNGAMVAGIGYHMLTAGERSDWNTGVAARVAEFRGQQESSTPSRGTGLRSRPR